MSKPMASSATSSIAGPSTAAKAARARPATAPRECAASFSPAAPPSTVPGASARYRPLSVARIVGRAYDARSTFPRREQQERVMAEKLISGDNHIDLTYLPPDLWSSEA